MAILNNPMGALAAVNVRAGVAVATGGPARRAAAEAATGNPDDSSGTRLPDPVDCDQLAADISQLQADINALEKAQEACSADPNCPGAGTALIAGMLVVKTGELLALKQQYDSACGE